MSTPFQRVVDDLTGGDGCACHTGIGYNAACRHCQPQMYPPERSVGAAPLCPMCGGPVAVAPQEYGPAKLAAIRSAGAAPLDVELLASFLAKHVRWWDDSLGLGRGMYRCYCEQWPLADDESTNRIAWHNHVAAAYARLSEGTDR